MSASAAAGTARGRTRRKERPAVPRSTRALFASARRGEDRRAKEMLVRRFLPLARKLARRYHGGGEPLEDLVQVANVGLVKAVERYDDSRGVTFPTYAVPTITGELKRHFRDNTWATHVPRPMRERALEVHRATARINDETGREPTVATLAERLELDEQEVLDGLIAHGGFRSLSLDAPVNTIDDGEAPPTRGESIGDLDGGFERVEVRQTLRAALRKVPLRERRVLHMRYIEDRTQAEIAAQIGVSQMQVSRMIKRALDRMRADLKRARGRPRR